MIVDPSWNPAHDLQAQDRAFRIGQRRDVGVYRLVSTGAASHHLHTVSPHTYAHMYACLLTSLTHCLSTHMRTHACMPPYITYCLSTHMRTYACMLARTHAHMDGHTDRFMYSLTPCIATYAPMRTGRCLLAADSKGCTPWTHTSLQHHGYIHFSCAAEVAYTCCCLCCYTLARSHPVWYLIDAKCSVSCFCHLVLRLGC